MSRFRMFALTFFLLMVAGPFVRAQEIPPLSLTSGWNLVGMPCNISAMELRSVLGDPGLAILDWSNGAYESPLELHRGSAYFLNTTQGGVTASICPPDQTAQDPYAPHLVAGWNLVGNPYAEATNLENMFPRNRFFNPTWMTNPAWALLNNRFTPLNVEQTIQPWQGFFLYYEIYSVTGYLIPDNCTAPCAADADCDDGNPDTADTCVHAGACTAACLNRYTGNACADGSIPKNGQCSDVWLYFEPDSCGANPWQFYNGYTYSADKTMEKGWITDFFRDKFNIEVRDMRACVNYINPFTECTFPDPWDMSILVSSADAQTILASHLLPDINDGLGRYIDLDPIPEIANPPACVADMPDTDCGDSCIVTCVDGSISQRRNCPDIQFSLEPAQCGGNPWDKAVDPSILGVDPSFQIDDHAQLLTDYLATHYGIAASNVWIQQLVGPICLACCCGNGTILFFTVSNEDAERMIGENLLEGGCTYVNLTIRGPQSLACAADEDCDDHDDQTTDTCFQNAQWDGQPMCVHTPMPPPPACATDADCGQGAFCTNPGGPAAACVTPAGCPAKTIICSHPQGCDTILWNKPDCAGDNCQADPPGGDYSSYAPTDPGAVYGSYLPECSSRVDTSEQINGRTYFKMQSDCAPASPDQDEGYLRVDDNWQLFGIYEIRECVFRETLYLPLAAEAGSTWDIYEPSAINWTQTSLAHNRMISRTECSYTNKDDSIQGEVLNFHYNAVDSVDEESDFCYIPGRGIVDRFNPGP